MKAALLLAVSLISTTGMAKPRSTDRLAELAFARGSVQPANLDAQVDELADWTIEHPDGLLVLDGHADDHRSSAANARLSLARAQAVRDRLVARGVNPEQLVIAAYGSARSTKRVIVWALPDGTSPVMPRVTASDVLERSTL